jgi:hypothetical protein
VSEKTWLEQYADQSIGELIALDSGHRVDSILVALEQALNQKMDNKGNDSLSQAEQDVIVIEAMEREVNNGGYNQFLSNCPEHIPFLLGALERAGCSQTLEISREVMKMVDKVRANLEAADEDEIGETLEKCDEAYFQSGESIECLLFEYVRKNQGQFDIP